MSTTLKLASVIDTLPQEHQETLLGASLSKQFAKLPLWLSHPSNIGGFYGFLVALALIFTLPVWRGGELRLVERLDSSLCLANGLVLLSGNLLDVNYINIWKITGSPSKDYSLPYAIYWTSIVVN